MDGMKSAKHYHRTPKVMTKPSKKPVSSGKGGDKPFYPRKKRV